MRASYAVALLAMIGPAAKPNESRCVFVDAAAATQGDGSPFAPFPSVTLAIQALQAGQGAVTEVWLSGRFPPLQLPPACSGSPGRPIVFRAWAGKPPPVFDALGAPTQAIAINGNSWLVFRGITGVNGGGKVGLGLFLNDAAHVVVEDCVFRGNEEAGLCCKGATDVRVHDCVFEDNAGDGIIIPFASGIIVKACRMKGNGGDGICADRSDGLVITGNAFTGNAFPMSLNALTNVDISHNSGVKKGVHRPRDARNSDGRRP